MNNTVINKISTIIVFLVILCNSTIYCQVIAGDTVLDTRQNLIRKLDSLKIAGSIDTSANALSSINKAANELITFDNNLINNNITPIIKAIDSLKRINDLNQTTIQSHSLKISNLYNSLYFLAGIALFAFVLFIVMLLGWLRRKNNINKLSVQHLENEKILSEYRKKLNEIQSDLDNSRSQAKTLVNENSRLEKEISLLADEIQKARNAGWLPEEGETPYPEQIRALEKQLAEESTRKKILEQEMLEMLRKLRGEE